MSKEVQKWADEAMFEAEPIKRDEKGRILPKVYLIQATGDPLGSVAAACRMYEGKVTRSLSDVTDDERRNYWEQVKKTHLKAPLEFVDFHFLIEGVTRSFTHQMVRQRTAVYAQESLRFAVKENLEDEIAFPSHIGDAPGDLHMAWDSAIEAIAKSYRYLIDSGMPAEDARGLLPHATTTRLHFKTNLRNLVDHAGNRLCTQAQFEWRFAFTGIMNAIRKYQSGYFGADQPGLQVPGNWQFRHIADSDLFRPVCYQIGHCPFTADFDRKCSIRERVQRGEFDKIDDREWLMNPGAAR